MNTKRLLDAVRPHSTCKLSDRETVLIRVACSIVNAEHAELLREAKAALINRDAVQCYVSGTTPCECTICKINRMLTESEIPINVNDMLSRPKPEGRRG